MSASPEASRRIARGSRHRRPSRRGSTMIIAMVAVFLAGALLSASLRCLIQQHATLDAQLRTLQADLVADAALDRAALANRLQSDYDGGTYTVAISETTRAAVVVRVEQGPDDQRQVTARVSLGPTDAPNRQVVCQKVAAVERPMAPAVAVAVDTP